LDKIVAKVYCKNCKWFQSNDWGTDKCKRETGKYIENNITGDYKEIIKIKATSRNYPNKNGDCEFYKQKWWKIWAGVKTEPQLTNQTIERGL